MAQKSIKTDINDKSLVLLSGGLDSGCLLSEVVENNKNVETISFKYGSKHNKKELEAAKRISDFYKIKNTVIDLSFMQQLFVSNLFKEQGEIPLGHYNDESMKDTVVPFRNPIFLSIASGYALSNNFDVLYIGIHRGDHFIYPDCRPEFYDIFRKLIVQCSENSLKLSCPFINVDKSEIVKRGISSGFPFSLSYTCYKGDNAHCGECGSCRERLEAFSLNNKIDEVKYVDFAKRV